MSNIDPRGTDWTDGEIDLIVADYFEMLRMEVAQQPYVKSHRNAALQELTGRSRGSIEFKHQNISAVLRYLGEPWIPGYKPMTNYQRALIDGVERRLAAPDKMSVFYNAANEAIAHVAAAPALFFEAPPDLRTADASQVPEVLRRLVRKFDPAERDARNARLGKLGEERVYFSERERLADAGRKDLAAKVKWVSEEVGDGAGYDILSFDQAGRERLLEVKTTMGYQRTPFYLTENERLLSEERPKEFRLVRLYDFAKTPKAFELAPPLADSVTLSPISYRASFG